MDTAKTRAAAVSYHSAHGSGAARAGRFPRADRIDPGVCGNVSGFVLGKQVVARKVQVLAKIKLKIKTRCKTELIRHGPTIGLMTDGATTLRYLRGPAWIGDGSCSRENTLPLLCHNHAKRNSNNSRLRDSAAIDSRPDRPGEFLTLPAR